MTSPLYSELPQELLLDVEPMRPAGGGKGTVRSRLNNINNTKTVR